LVTSNTTDPEGTALGDSETAHSDRLTWTVFGWGFSTALASGEKRHCRARLKQSRYSVWAGPMRNLEMAFMDDLQVQVWVCVSFTNHDRGETKIFLGPKSPASRE
jgi:hypothetical protein